MIRQWIFYLFLSMCIYELLIVAFKSSFTEKWGVNIYSKSKLLSPIPHNKVNYGYDERDISEHDTNMYNITMNHLKLKLLKRLTNKNVSVNEKLEHIDSSSSSDYTPNLLIGRLIEDW